VGCITGGVRGDDSTVAARVLWPVLSEASARGIDTNLLIREQRLDPVTLEQPDARLSQAQAAGLWRALERCGAGDDLGVRAARRSPQVGFGVVQYAARACANLGEAICRGTRYLALLNTAAELRLTVRGGLAYLAYVNHSHVGPLPRLIAEYTLASLHHFGRLATGRSELVEVHFQHAAPADIAAHEQLFAGRLCFEARTNQVVFPARALALPLLSADGGLRSILDRCAEEELVRLGMNSSVAARVRTIIGQILAEGTALELDAVARRLHCSARTLQRRLRAEETSVHELVDEVRQQLACRLLEASDLSLADIAYRLDLADASALVRAFRRWCGMSPGQWRSRSRAAASAVNAQSGPPR
jgi:AraC-like DNA-binding protein